MVLIRKLRKKELIIIKSSVALSLSFSCTFSLNKRRKRKKTKRATDNKQRYFQLNYQTNGQKNKNKTKKEQRITKNVIAVLINKLGKKNNHNYKFRPTFLFLFPPLSRQTNGETRKKKNATDNE